MAAIIFAHTVLFLIHEEIYVQEIKKKYYVGIQKLTKESLEDTIRRGEKLDIRVVGMLIIDDDVSYDLIGKAIASINLAGVVRCGERLQKYFGK